MKFLPLLVLFILLSCSTENKKSDATGSDESVAIENEITEFHQALKRAYNGAYLNTDSLMDHYFGKDVYYVTYWGTSEPIDSTKSRLRHALPGIRDYDNRLEGVNVKVYGDGAYAFFILRQTYSLNGILMDEYLPTTFVLERAGKMWKVMHAQRSADFQTIQQLMAVAQRSETASPGKK
ncbi:MAG: hypothetical protein EHM64_11015 [Ignavibacteriae bacterium]|nr:MAG: hypothetical protein EHM64_11015 [Ignavibacteriota bacterium]